MKKIPVKKSVFIELAKIASCDVVMSTHDGYYKQIDGLAMGSPPAPHLANGWMSKFDRQIQGNAKLFMRYMDDTFLLFRSFDHVKKFFRYIISFLCLNFCLNFIFI